jgi:hypothetical protein
MKSKETKTLEENQKPKFPVLMEYVGNDAYKGKFVVLFTEPCKGVVVYISPDHKYSDRYLGYNGTNWFDIDNTNSWQKYEGILQLSND